MSGLDMSNSTWRRFLRTCSDFKKRCSKRRTKELETQTWAFTVPKDILESIQVKEDYEILKQKREQMIAKNECIICQRKLVGGPLPIRVMDGCSVHIKCIEKWEKRHQCGAKATVKPSSAQTTKSQNPRCKMTWPWKRTRSVPYEAL